jgi:hypothetical protein
MFGDYTYDVGNLVQLVRGGKVWTVVWRGQLKLRNASGTVGRVNIYCLDNGYWDCYYEDEVHTA